MGGKQTRNRQNREAVDLASVPRPIGDPAVERDTLKKAEMEKGLRCTGCGERVTRGWRFYIIEAMYVRSRAVASVGTVVACTREECDFAFVAGKEAAAMEQVEYRFMDSPEMRKMFGSDAPQGERPDPGVLDRLRRPGAMGEWRRV